MCGIIGYIGNRNAVTVVLEGLKRLEYRGYDSAGIAFFSEKGVDVIRCKGKIKDLASIVEEKSLISGCGIGHTRWATHGKPSEENAHPHRSGGIVVVHNGIIENYLQLKKKLIDRGYKFESDTDTEVLCHLIRDYSETLPLEDAVRAALREVKGAYAIAVVNEKEPNKIVGVRKDSPLVVGLGDGEYFLASDVPAFMHYSREVIFLDEGEIVVITSDGVVVSDFDGMPLHKEVKSPGALQWQKKAVTGISCSRRYWQPFPARREREHVERPQDLRHVATQPGQTHAVRETQLRGATLHAGAQGAVPHEDEGIRCRTQRQQRAKRALDAAHVRAPRPGRSAGLRASIRSASASAVGSGIDVVDEARAGSNRRADPQGPILTADEGLEVIVDDRFGESGEVLEAAGVEEDGMPPQALGHAGDGGLGATRGAADLAVCGAGGQALGDGEEELGSFEVVGGGEGLAGASGVEAVATAEARDASWIVFAPVGSEALEAAGCGGVGGAIGVGTEGGTEAGGTHGIEGVNGPAHGWGQGKAEARGKGPRFAGLSVRRASG